MTEFIQCRISIFNHLRTKYQRMNMKTTTVVENYNFETIRWLQFWKGRSRMNMHLSDNNQNLILQNQTRYAVMAEQRYSATSSWSSSFLNCTDITERAVPIHTARGGTVMTTTHVCLKTYYVRNRTGELRPIATKTYIVRISIMIYYHLKCLTKQDIESISIKIQKNLGYLRRFFGQWKKDMQIKIMSFHELFAANREVVRILIMALRTPSWPLYQSKYQRFY